MQHVNDHTLRCSCCTEIRTRHIDSAGSSILIPTAVLAALEDLLPFFSLLLPPRSGRQDLLQNQASLAFEQCYPSQGTWRTWLLSVPFRMLASPLGANFEVAGTVSKLPAPCESLPMDTLSSPRRGPSFFFSRQRRGRPF